MADKRISELVATNIVDPGDRFILQRGATNLNILGSDLIAALEGNTIGGQATSTLVQNPTGLEDGYAIVWDNTAGEYTLAAAGASTFLALTDTPSSYTSQGLKGIRVNTGETALEFVDLADPTQIATQATDALVQSPTVTEDGYVIAWNNTNNEYELVAGGGGGGLFASAQTLSADLTHTQNVGNEVKFVQSGDYGNNAMWIYEANAVGASTVAKTRYQSTTASNYVDIGVNGAANTNADHSFILSSTPELLIQNIGLGSLLKLQVNNAYATMSEGGTGSTTYFNMGGAFDAPRTNAIYGGLRLPYGSTANRPVHGGATDLEGYIRYNSDTNKIEGYELSGGWQDLISAGGADGNGIYDGSGTIPGSTVATLSTGGITFDTSANQNDNVEIASAGVVQLDLYSKANAGNNGMRFYQRNSASAKTHMASWLSRIETNTAGSETASMLLQMVDNGTLASGGQYKFHVNGLIQFPDSINGGIYRPVSGATAGMRFGWFFDNSGGNKHEYAGITTRIVDGTDGSEDGEMKFYVTKAGSTFSGTNQDMHLDGTGLAIGASLTPSARLHVRGGSGQSPLRIDTSAINNALLVDSNGRIGMNLAGASISTSTRVHIHKQDTTHHLITTDTSTTGRTSMWMQGSGGSDLFMGIWGSAFAGIDASYQGTSFFDTDVLHRFISRNAVGWQFVTDNSSLSAPVSRVVIDGTGLDVTSGNNYKHAGVAGFTGTGAYTNFTISGGIITSAS